MGDGAWEAILKLTNICCFGAWYDFSVFNWIGNAPSREKNRQKTDELRDFVFVFF